ncbi:MAG: hypothetical protein HOV77_33805 [Hamadaea sp.]|uniref:DUF5709 domain-containing protein n=1 Tax=Hamadaea sp. TaxID=2024425 RepID=UPI0018555E89|nr:DUF5709 domain-containing protein [Hamadaea sp.]NUT24157.1 hypothetical protein [Hamadaea sp.]
MTVPDGIPDYADDTSTAYDTDDSERITDDTAPALPGDEPSYLPDESATPEEEADLAEGPSQAYDADRALEGEFDDPDEESDEVLVEDEAPDPYADPDSPVGRLVAPDLGAGVDDEAEAWGEDTGEDDQLTAEESAMHIDES